VRIAIDTGGTFTDCVFWAGGALQLLKIFSTPDHPGNAALQAVREMAPGDAAEVRHGTTVGTNAMLERKGARIAFVTTAGFEDTIAIGRQARTSLYDWFATPPPCIVPRELRFGVQERTSAEGVVLESPAQTELDGLCEAIRASGAEAVALSLLFSFANPHNEIVVGNSLKKLGLPLSVSHLILPEFREYERASTVAVNAYLEPKVSRYLSAIATGLQEISPHCRFDVMQSSGGTIAAQVAAEQPVRTVLSGPAGGVMGAYRVARLAGFDKIIAFDMGGTSTDVALVDGEAGGPTATNESIVSGMPISVPMLDIHTVGAGGGSLAWFDDAGILHVGPESAGADPGPICYGSGMQATVSDANLILGRLVPDHFLGGKIRLDTSRTRAYMERARLTMASVEEFSEGIIRLAEAEMEKAIRVISVERGYDPREFALVAFGGAGPLHASALARALGIPRVLVPKMPGALSALGILLADTVRDYSKTVMLGGDSPLETLFAELERLGAEESGGHSVRAVSSQAVSSQTLSSQASFTRSADIRYAGQGYELNVPAGPDMLQNFHRAHRRRYGHCDESRTVEVVNVRVRVTLTAEPVELERSRLRDGDGRQARIGSRRVIFGGEPCEAPVYDREGLQAGDRFSGPAIVTEYSSTTVVPWEHLASVDAGHNLVIEAG
jgi:N-methylhydantoinase A